MQRPRVASVPEWDSSLGREAVELAAYAGLTLDDWQAWTLTEALGLKPDGMWSAAEVGVVVPRQNGKNGLLEARQLAGLFLLEERLQIHSAHQFDTSLEAFRRLSFLVESRDEFTRRVKRIVRSHGEEGIELHNGCRIRFRTRTKGGGRGFSADALYLDEAMELPESTHSALMPTMSAMPNPQVWYTGSAVDEAIHDNGFVLARLRERGMAGSPSLLYAEWSADEDAVRGDHELAGDPAQWALGNPALGGRIRHEHVALERESMADRSFLVERLGVGFWPDTSGGQHVIPNADVEACLDTVSTVEDPVMFSVDMSPDRRWASIAVAGGRADGLGHVEVVDEREGSQWVVGRLAELVGRHRTCGPVWVDEKSPAGSLIPDLEQAGVEVHRVTATEHSSSCGMLVDAFSAGTLRHLGQSSLRGAIRAAAKRPLLDSWAWSRKHSEANIAPLVAVTLAYGGWRSTQEQRGWLEDHDLVVLPD